MICCQFRRVQPRLTSAVFLSASFCVTMTGSWFCPTKKLGAWSIALQWRRHTWWHGGAVGTGRALELLRDRQRVSLMSSYFECAMHDADALMTYALQRETAWTCPVHLSCARLQLQHWCWCRAAYHYLSLMFLRYTQCAGPLPLCIGNAFCCRWDGLI